MHRAAPPRSTPILFLLVCVLLVPVPAGAQLPYVATEIPVRDGKALAADTYHNGGWTPKPSILVQTPYNRLTYRVTLGRAASTFPLDTMRYHYIFVDWRGFYGSSGAAETGYDRGLDGYDIVEWIASQPWSDGQVATYGGSALGMIQFQTARHRPPHLVCAMPMIIDYRTEYGDYYYGGVLRKEHVQTLERLGFVTVALVTSQPVENAYWDFILQRNDYPEEIAVPLLMVSGWFDHYPSDVLRAFTDLQQRSSPSVRAAHKLIMGPWLHGEVDREKQGELTFPGSAMVARGAALEFFDYHLNGAKNGWPLKPAVRYYRMGSNVWESAARWDEAASGEQTMYLHADGRLDRTPAPLPAAEQSFLSDPSDPSPSHGGARFDPFDPSVEAGPLDIHGIVERRSDVLLYTSDALDAPVRFTGGVRVIIRFRADRRDIDVAVRLCDVFPDGRSIILTDGIQRARFRNGTRSEELLIPNEETTLTVQLQEIAHTFLPGHRIRLVISGSDFPRFDVNPNSGGPLYSAGDSLTARITLRTGGTDGCRLVFDGDLAVSITRTSDPAPAPRIHAISPQPWRRSDGAGIRIGYSASAASAQPVLITVCDLLGRPVRQLHPELKGNAETAFWDGRTASGTPAPAGTYFIVLRQGASRAVRPVILLH